jgi:3-hydroxyacyl-CoA dehydrogenase / enoyl-CoA hydratase / 3-hydroxybutyryl-CoA epimerase
MTEVSYSLDRDSRVATLTVDTAGPVNTIGQQFVTDLEKASSRALEDEVRGVLIVSAKKKSFLDGANLKEFLIDATPAMVGLVVLRYQQALEFLARSPFPVVAVLDGQSALGGGFELLLWSCDHVFATSSSKMGLPEVNVGLFPAGGGTQTLRRVIGFRKAVDMIMNGRVRSADSFADSAVITVCESGALKAEALAWLDRHQGILNRNCDPDFPEPDPISDEEKQKVVNQARFRYTTSPCRPYFQAAVEALESGLRLSFDAAVRNEIDLFVPLIFHPNTRNKIDFFFLATSTAPRLVKVDRSAAVPADRLAVIGTGLMGQGIAQVAADNGMHVTLIDVDEARTKAGRDMVEQGMEELVARGRWPESRKDAAMANLACSTAYEDLRDIPLVIECVFEDLALKKRILAQVQEQNPGAIFASNTSTIPMADIAAESPHPQHVVGMHFFSPVPLMPLLEVIQGGQSSPASVATAVTVGRAMGKTVIRVGDGPGFYTSRTFGNYVLNGLRLAELGVPPWEVDLLALQAGFPQGPLHVYGTTGGNVIYHANRFLAERRPDRVHMAPTLERLFHAGYVGAGRPSFYLDPRKMTPDESVLEYIVHREGFPRPSDEDARDVLLLGMVNEAFWCLSEGVLHDYLSMDLGAVLGIGFPDCWHGPARYVSIKGVAAVKARLEELAGRFDIPSLTPAPEFEQLIACGLDSSLV